MKRFSMKPFMLTLLSQYHKTVVIGRLKIPAAEQICAIILLSPDRKLARDHRGYWNHSSLLTEVRDINTGEPFLWFNGGYKGRTIDRLIEMGRLRPTKFDEKARPTEVEWVPL